MFLWLPITHLLLSFVKSYEARKIQATNERETNEKDYSHSEVRYSEVYTSLSISNVVAPVLPSAQHWNTSSVQKGATKFSENKCKESAHYTQRSYMFLYVQCVYNLIPKEII